MNDTTTSKVYAVEQMDKGVWEVIDRETMQPVGKPYPSRSAARKALAELKGEAPAPKAEKTKTQKTPKAKPVKVKVEKTAADYAPTDFAMKKRAKNFDAIREQYDGALPAGLLDVFNPRNVDGFVTLWATIAADFDTSSIGTTYVLRVESTGALHECSDKRDGRLAASKIGQ